MNNNFENNNYNRKNKKKQAIKLKEFQIVSNTEAEIKSKYTGKQFVNKRYCIIYSIFQRAYNYQYNEDYP